MKVKHLVLLTVSIVVTVVLLFVWNRLNYNNNKKNGTYDILESVPHDSTKRERRKDEEKIEINKNDVMLPNNKDNSFIDVEETVPQEGVIIEEDIVSITNYYLLQQIIVGEEDEIKVLQTITDFIKERHGVSQAVATLLEQSIFNDGTNLFFLGVVDGYEEWIKVTYNTLTLEVSIEPYLYQQLKEMDRSILELIAERQSKYPESLGKEYVYEEKEFSMLEDILYDYYYGISFGNYDTVYKITALADIKEYLPTISYDYFKFLQYTDLLLSKSNGNGVEPILKGYIKFEDYYLAKVSLFEMNSTGKLLEEKWITVFINSDGRMSVFPEDLKCIDLWNAYYN